MCYVGMNKEREDQVNVAKLAIKEVFGGGYRNIRRCNIS